LHVLHVPQRGVGKGGLGEHDEELQLNVNKFLGYQQQLCEPSYQL